MPMAAALLVLLCSVFAAESPLPALLGVDLGSTYISASQFNATGPVPLAYVQGTEEYRQLMVDRLESRHDQYDLAHATRVFQEAFQSVQQEASRVKGEPLRIGAVSHPPDFEQSYSDNFYMAMGAAYRNVGVDRVIPVRLRSRLHLRGVTYPPDFCLRSWGEDPVDDAVFVLLFEHASDEMTVALLSVDSRRSRTVSESSFGWPTTQENIEYNIQKRLRAEDGSGTHVDFNKLPSIIISTQDPATDVAIVHRALAATFPQLVPRVQHPPGGTHFVAAHGTACVARQIALKAEKFEPTRKFSCHDELQSCTSW